MNCRLLGPLDLAWPGSSEGLTVPICGDQVPECLAHLGRQGGWQSDKGGMGRARGPPLLGLMGAGDWLEPLTKP